MLYQLSYASTELQLQGPPVEDLCKPHPIAHGLNSEPTPAPDVQDRAGKVILHLLSLSSETNLCVMDVVPSGVQK
jgi:hypothetical protein